MVPTDGGIPTHGGIAIAGLGPGDPGARTVAVHAPGRPVVILTEIEEPDGGDVLPEFRLPVAEVFA